MHPACMLHECFMNMHVSYLVLGRFLGKFHAWTCTIHVMRMLLAWLHVAINCMKHACYMHGICLLHAWYCACCMHVHSLVLHTCYMHVSNCSSHKSPNIIMHGTCMYICKNTLYAAIMTTSMSIQFTLLLGFSHLLVAPVCDGKKRKVSQSHTEKL